jgi:hypothetical protein
MAWGPTPTPLTQLTPSPKPSRYALGFGLSPRPHATPLAQLTPRPQRSASGLSCYFGIGESHPAMSDGLTPFTQPSKA